MITTANARNPTNRTPMDVSSRNGEWARIKLRLIAISAAAPNAPTVVSTPRMNATAIPGSTPWARASPMKLMPRNTIQVPTIEVVSTTSKLA